MKKSQKSVLALLAIFVVLLSTTLFVSFSSNTDIQEVIVKSITPIYDSNSTVVVDDNNVVFNDKNQTVEYKVVIENTQNYDVKITDIKLTTPTEEFLEYKVEGINKDDVVSANSTKELTVSFETTGIKGWGRNFADELTANISFEKVAKQEEVVPPVEEEKQPEAPAINIEEVINKSEKIEIEKITNNTIEFKDGIKLEDGDKAETWIYPETKFYGYNEVDESNVIKQIVLDNDKLDELEVKSGEHNVVILTEDKEVLGYVEIYINEDKELLTEKPQDTTNREETSKEDTEKVDNPYTSDKGLLTGLIIATGVTGLLIIVVSKNKLAKYTIFIVVLSNTLTLVNAEKVNEISININASFKSQNVMTKSYISVCEESAGVPPILKGEVYEEIEEVKEVVDAPISIDEIIEGNIDSNDRLTPVPSDDVLESAPSDDESENDDVLDSAPSNDEAEVCQGTISKEPQLFWKNIEQIKNIYIQNEITEINKYEFVYDVSEEQNGRVMAYLVKNENDSSYYDLYIQADGVIYPNEDSSGYFAGTVYLNSIDNLEGLDTSKVTNMSWMFANAGYNSENFTLDISNFDTSKVTDMSYMFAGAGYNNPNFTLDVSNFDTSNVTNMREMFTSTGYNSTEFKLDLSNFDTSNVTNMSCMFYSTGYNNPNFTLDVSNFDTSKVTDMSGMFSHTGYNSTNFTLDVSNFNTSKVTDMSNMFNMSKMLGGTFHNSETFTLNVSNFDTSNVTNMSGMFAGAGYNNPNFTLDVSNFNTSKVTDMSDMFSHTGYNSPNFTLDVSNFDTSYVRYYCGMFDSTGFNSTKLNISITIRNPNAQGSSVCSGMMICTCKYIFPNSATKSGTKITVNYTSETTSLVDKMIASKSEGSNIVKGTEVEIIERNGDLGEEVGELIPAR